MRLLLILITAAVAAAQTAPRFTDVTKAAGIAFRHNAGKAGKKWLPETMGSGCAFVDADGDGWLDIVLINSRDWTPRAGRRSTSALYRNNRDGTFTDVTKGSGLDVEIYGLGVAAGWRLLREPGSAIGSGTRAGGGIRRRRPPR